MIINSLLDQDFYKFTMAQAVLHYYPTAYTKFEFKDRKGNGFPTNDTKERDVFLNILNAEIDHLCSLKFQEDEIEYLKTIPFLSLDFIDILENFSLKRKYIKVGIDNDELYITIKGPWFQTIWFEVPIMAIISELHTRKKNGNRLIARSNLINKIRDLKKEYSIGIIDNLKFADFGTRRRFSFNFQNDTINLLNMLLPGSMFIGTSNVYFAKKFNIKPIGTMAHEWIMAHQQLNGNIINSQHDALEVWQWEYCGNLGIALSDTLGFKAFKRDFDKPLSMCYDGVRHDSGDPIKWGNEMIEHYKKCDINPLTKTLVFSDGLTFDKIMELYGIFNNHINVSFGIGTNLTNDSNIDAPSIVIKMVECNGLPVAKISDSKGKGMCKDETYLKYLKNIFRI